jgi:two-component system cell cycle sensor histidine kinase/response regulator CckA
VKSILVVDDMPQTLMLLRRVLQSQGHSVFSAEDAATAYSICRSHGADIGLVLMDMSIGRTWGDQLASVLKEQMPHCRFVFMTDLDVEELEREGHLTATETVVRKPFRVSEVTEVVRNALRDHLPAEAPCRDVILPHKNS